MQASMERTGITGLIKFDVGPDHHDRLWLCEKYTGVPMSDLVPRIRTRTRRSRARDTGGVFQMSGTDHAHAQDMAPTKFGDLSAAIALYRPGPLERTNGQNYIDRMRT